MSQQQAISHKQQQQQRLQTNQNTKKQIITLGYWALRGRGQVPRHLLSYLGLQFKEVSYGNVTDWFAHEKKSIGLDFPNLPWLKHGDFNLTQFDAINRYIIEISDQPQLLGKTNQDKALITSIYGVVFDAITLTNVLFYDKNYESKLKQVWQKAKPKFDYLNNFIKDRKTCLQYLTYVDFVIAELLCHYIPYLYPQQSKQYPFMTNIRENIQNLQGVKAYYERPNAIKQPHVATWFSAIKY